MNQIEAEVLLAILLYAIYIYSVVECRPDSIITLQSYHELNLIG